MYSHWYTYARDVIYMFMMSYLYTVIVSIQQEMNISHKICVYVLHKYLHYTYHDVHLSKKSLRYWKYTVDDWYEFYFLVRSPSTI